MKEQHLLVDLSSHGFGHFAQASMVLNALHKLEPTLQITMRGTLPEHIIHERLEMPVTYLKHSLDVGMKMHSPVAVDAGASYDYYQGFHDDYRRHVDAEADALKALSPDLLLANVPYVSLSAAQALGIPSIAMCSLNWAGIFQSFCQEFAGSEKIIHQITQAYSSAESFLMVTPHMSMESLGNGRAIPPIAHTGMAQENLLRDYVRNPKAKFVLVSLGGIPAQIDTVFWPELENVYWVIGEGITSVRGDVVSNKDVDLSFIDLLSSCDAIITKTGYGTLVEAVASQTPVICIERGDWPEEPALFDWVRKEGYLEILQMQEMESGNFANAVRRALKTDWQKAPVECNGADVAANIIRSYLLNLH